MTRLIQFYGDEAPAIQELLFFANCGFGSTGLGIPQRQHQDTSTAVLDSVCNNNPYKCYTEHSTTTTADSYHNIRTEEGGWGGDKRATTVFYWNKCPGLHCLKQDQL